MPGRVEAVTNQDRRPAQTAGVSGLVLESPLQLDGDDGHPPPLQNLEHRGLAGSLAIPAAGPFGEHAHRPAVVQDPEGGSDRPQVRPAAYERDASHALEVQVQQPLPEQDGGGDAVYPSSDAEDREVGVHVGPVQRDQEERADARHPLDAPKLDPAPEAVKQERQVHGPEVHRRDEEPRAPAVAAVLAGESPRQGRLLDEEGMRGPKQEGRRARGDEPAGAAQGQGPADQQQLKGDAQGVTNGAVRPAFRQPARPCGGQLAGRRTKNRAAPSRNVSAANPGAVEKPGSRPAGPAPDRRREAPRR